MTRRVLRNFRNLATNGEGAAAVAREKFVRWQRKPESMIICFLSSGLANFRRKIFYKVSQLDSEEHT